jgi:predicted transcriptional regulator
MPVTARDIETSIKDIQSFNSVISALLKRRQYGPAEFQKINKQLGAAATLISRAVADARKLGESTASSLLDRIDDRIDELQEETDYKTFFNKMLKKWGVDSIDDLSDEDKKKFFAEIEKEWTGEKE